MIDLPLFRYQALLVDPPWDFESWSDGGNGRGAVQHYDVMGFDAIKALPIGHLASKDCALFLWITSPLLMRGEEVMNAWGFTYKTVAFDWTKTCRLPPLRLHMGNGYWTRSNNGYCLLGTMGEPKRKSKAVKQAILEPIREHSRKPDRIYHDIERLVDGPYAEIFSRSSRSGWDSWGNDVGKFGEVTENTTSGAAELP